MPWAVLAAVAASAATGAVLGWPMGFIAAAGCLLLPFAAVQALLYLFPPRVLRPPQPREPLRVTAITLAPGIRDADAVPASAVIRKAIPGTAGDADTRKE